MVETAPYKLLIVDDHALVRSGMRAVLEDRAPISAIDEASNGERAVDMAAQSHYDMVLMDMNLPGMNGLEASERIIQYLPEVRIIMVTGQVDAALSRSFAQAGITGYISKDSNADEIRNAVRRVIDGNAHLSPDVAQRVAIDMMQGELTNPFDKLTTRENEIVQLVFEGKRNLHIAQALFISEKTVSTHRTRAFEKLGVSNAAELIRLAMRHGLLELS